MEFLSVNDGNMSGALETSDLDNPQRTGHYADDYLLNDLVADQEYFIKVTASDFDADLQLINSDTGDVIAEFNDYADTSDAQFAFTPQAGINYVVRVTSKRAGIVGNYTLSASETLPVDLELSLLVDVSGSVSPSEYTSQINGYVDTFEQEGLYENLIAQGLDGRIAVNFILWSGSQQQAEVVRWTLIDSDATAKVFAQTLREATLPEFGGSRPFSGSTSPGRAIDFADDLVFANEFASRRQAIEISGDDSGATFTSQTARDNALAQGIDVINGVVIGISTSALSFYQNNLIAGTTADGQPAFVETARNFEEFGAVINEVLIRELTPRAFFSVSDASIQEGDVTTSQLEFVVSLSRASDQEKSIDFATGNGSAIAESDFVSTSGTLTFAPGETSKIVTVDVIDDNRLEADETFSLVLSNAVNADLREIPGVGTITDNDTLQLSNTTVDENALTGTVVGVLSATDANDPDPFTFSLVNNAGGRFAISGDQLQVADRSQLDFEANSSHNVTVQAVDSVGNTFEQEFVIAVNDLDDGDPGNPPPSNPLQVTISAPSRIGATGTDFVTVTYTNTGDTDIAAPLLSLTATGAVFTPINSTEFTEESIQFLGINDDGLAGVLPAGASNSLTIEFQPTAGAGERIDFSVSTVNPDEVIDWQALKSQLKPDYLTDEAWNDIYGNFVASVGNTAGDYEQLLIQNANYLSEQGEYVTDANRLVGFEFQQASDYQALAQRNSLGSFGRGRFFIGDIRANTDAEGNVAIVNGGTQRSFTRQSDGSYAPSTGDYGTLVLGNGVYTLTEPSGTITVFRADGQLDYIEDTNDNRITGQYSNELLTGLVAINGDSLTLTRNGAGLIDSVTDSAGRTTTYDYTGELLTGVTSPEGTTNYTYDDNFALTSITDGNGIQARFDYDPQGRLIRESFNGGAEELTYNYGENGEVTVTDASGAVTQLFLNDRGQVSQLTDALGRTLRIGYDDAGNATQITAPDGSALGFVYDDEGNLLTQVNPLGQRTEFIYEPTFNSLASVTDPRGNALSYSYDDAGNLTTITYADGSRESFSYDDEGNVVQSINRRGQSISYDYNNRGQLLNQSNADGSSLAYIYDDRGNLTSATDASGTTTLEYDTADRLTKITYANGRSLAYTYDAGGRRTSMTDGDGNQVQYSYDAAGRLASLTNGNGDLIVAYRYDSVGRLVREDNGNGTYTTYTYDLAGQLTSIFNYAPDNSVNSRFVYDYDDLGQQTEVVTLDGTWTYSYDAIGQLTGAVFASTNPDIADQNLSYEYDAAGNRTRTVVNGETTDYTTNNLNQYESAGVVVYDYDTDGNLIAKTEGGNTWTYEYNNENRLVRVVDGAGVETRYEYDALGNRIATIHDGKRTEYLVDPFGLGDVVAEYDGTGGLVARYTHGIGLVSREDGNASAFYDSNAIGSTVGLTDALGTQVNSYHYLPFGSELAETEAINNPFEFVGKWGVMEEANDIDFMRARFYDSSTGRFSAKDPIGLSGEDANLYRYVRNNPINLIDPEGTFAFLAYPLLVTGIRFAVTRAVTIAARRALGSLAASAQLSAAGSILGAASGTILGVTEYYSITPSGQRSLEGALDYAEGKYALPLAKAGGLAGATFGLIPFRAAYAYLLYSILSDFSEGRLKNIADPVLDFLGTLPFLSLIDDVLIETLRSFSRSPLLEKLGLDEDLLRILRSSQVEVSSAQTNILDGAGAGTSVPDSPENQARSKGEPHLTTFDGVGYSFQGAGDFTLIESLDGDLDIQVRYVQIDPRATVANAVATVVDGQRVVIDSEGIEFVDGVPIVRRGTGQGVAKVTVNSEVVEIPSGGSITVGNSQIFRNPGEEYTIVYAGEDGIVSDGDDQLFVNYMRPGTINIVDVALGDEKKGQIRGLLGNLNDDPNDDVALLDGTPLPRPLLFDDVYGAFRDDWRIKDASESLFDYAEGQSPDTFYNPNFPASLVRFSDLDAVAQERGRAAALAAGYEEGTFEFFSAAFDFAITGDSAFLEGLETDPGADVPLSIEDSGDGDGGGGDGGDGTPLVNFTGADIQLQYFFPTLDAPARETLIATVNDDVEFSLSSFDDNPSDNDFESGYTIDITSNSILYQSVEAPVEDPFYVSAEFNGLVFTDATDTLPAIQNVTIDSSSTTFGIDASDITFTEDTILVNFEGISYMPGETFKLDVTFADTPVSDDVYEDNDTLETAYDLSRNESVLLSELSGLATQADDDWYRLNVLPDRNTLAVDVQFSHDAGDIDLELYDADGNFVTSSTSTTDNESLNEFLSTAGTYYLRVFGFGGETNTRYDLQWMSSLTDDAYEENDTQETAYDLTNFSDTPLTDIAGNGIWTDDDWYRFEMPADSEVAIIDLQFEHASGDLDLELYNANGDFLSSATSITDNESLQVSLDSGSYFVRVLGFDTSSTVYDLQWDAVPEDDGYEENDTLETAYDLTSLENIWLTDYENGPVVQIDEDWYRVELLPGETVLEVELAFSHADGDLDLVLYDEAGDFIANAISETDDERLEAGPLRPGTYYLQVYGYPDDTNSEYDLIWNSLFADDNYEENDSSETAYDLTGFEGILLSDFEGLGVQADEDWYRIDGLAAGEELVIDLQFAHEQGDIDLQLFNAELEVVASSGSVTDNESINLGLSNSGTYYIQVYGFGENTDNTYDLQWSTTTTA
jgi:RHS repeat-associated protein